MTKPIINFVCCFIWVHVVLAQKTTFKTGKPISKTYYAEIAYEDVGGKLIIPVTIQNTTYRFLFDTGAPNVISEDLAKDINARITQSISVSDANQKRQRMRIVTLPQLTMANVSFKNTSALVFEKAQNLVFDCFQIDGIIGSNLLRHSVVQIQPKNKLIIVTNYRRKLELNAHKGVELMLRGDQSSPYVSISLKGSKTAKEEVLIDTGASGFYDMCHTNYQLMKDHEIVQTYASGSGTSSIGLFGNAEHFLQYQVHIPQIELDGHAFKNVSTTTSSDNNSRLGSDILKYGNITLDFKRKRFYFHPFNDETDVTKLDFGFTPTIANNKLIVGVVWEEYLKDIIKAGDEIIKVNDMDYSKLNICDVITGDSPFRTFQTVDITFKTAMGKIISLTLEKH
ncbi:retropepsin-like aspartic protease [Aestuariivivens sediminis]|uniref:retropepsin-like aspartic protease n=1 Tax=Aestuariivivens sediminis TaxID=2913557 RepID=UPI001F59423A|nr:aspartyl protease family protein [Aestuariivivens sediminis]